MNRKFTAESSKCNFIDARIPGSNPGISQGWDYRQSPVTPLLGGHNKGLTRKPASRTLMGFVSWSALLQAGGVGGAGQWSLLVLAHCTSGLLDETSQKSAVTPLIL
jgi:hypothetical protein